MVYHICEDLNLVDSISVMMDVNQAEEEMMMGECARRICKNWSLISKDIQNNPYL